MEVTLFLEAFNALSSNAARRRALDLLTDELTPYEWRSLHSILSANHFEFDIVGHLPVELVAHVFGYLTTSTPYTLQLVSKRWAHVLRSVAVLQASLDQWFDGPVPIQQARYEDCLKQAQRIHAFRNGNIKNRYWLGFARGEQPESLQLQDDLLIWSPTSNLNDNLLYTRSVRALDLHNWKLRSFSGDAREKIWAFSASTDIIALATFANVCYVQELHGHGHKSFSVPGLGYFATVATRDRTVVCGRPARDHIEIYIWDFDSAVGKIVRFDHPPEFLQGVTDPECRHTHSWVLLPQPATRTIVVCADTTCTRQNVQQTCSAITIPLIFSRYTYAGELLTTSHLPSSIATNAHLRTIHQPCFIPVGRPDLFKFRVELAQTTGPNATKWMRYLLQYDERENEIAIINGPIDGTMHKHNLTAWWKDTFYSCRQRKEDPNSVITLIGSSGEPAKVRTVLRDNHKKPIAPLFDTEIFLNERYVIRKTLGGMYIGCFEESPYRPAETGRAFDLGKLEVLMGDEKELTSRTSLFDDGVMY
ncbi:hypothetical protein ACN47E_005362 [Coniothyrium glycines]